MMAGSGSTGLTGSSLGVQGRRLVHRPPPVCCCRLSAPEPSTCLRQTAQPDPPDQCGQVNTAYLCSSWQVSCPQKLPGRRQKLCNAEETSCQHASDLELCSQRLYLQQQVQAAHSPIPQVVQTVSGVVGVETFGPTLSRETAVLRRQRSFPNMASSTCRGGGGLTAPSLKGRLQPPQNWCPHWLQVK